MLKRVSLSFLLLFATFAIVLGHPGDDSLANRSLLPNGSFEKGDMVGWNPNSGHISVRHDRAYDGDQSVQFSGVGAPTALSLDHDKVRVTDGLNYRLTAYVYADSIGSRQSMPSIVLDFFDVHEKRIDRFQTYFYGTEDEWELVMLETTAPEGSVTAMVRIYAGQAYDGVLYLDNVSLISSEDASLLSNWSFEQRVFNDEIPGWFSDSRYVSVSDDRAFDGQHSVKLESSSASSPLRLAHERVPASIGVPYSVSAHVYVESDVDDASDPYVFIEFVDIDDGFLDRFKTEVTGTKGEWQHVVLHVVAPEETNGAVVGFHVDERYDGTVYVDRVQFVPGHEL